MERSKRPADGPPRDLGSEQKLHVGRPNLGDRQVLLRRLEDILDRRWLTNDGIYVQQFERRVADLLGVEHCIAMCNATIALGITARALELSGEVIMPAFTFVATAHALQWQQIKPVFCDIDPATHNLDPARIEELITPRTTGILGVHLWGRACDTAAIEAIAARHQLAVMYDASHAFACTHAGKWIGSFGRAEVFSFHATKFVNTLEGGLVATNDGDLAAKIRLIKNFGFTDYDQVDYLGTNGKMNEFSAAMGLTNLEAMEEFLSANRRNYETYRQELSGCSALQLLSYEDHGRHNYQYVVVVVDEEQAGISRDDLVAKLHRHDVIARRYFFPGCHRVEPYRSADPDASSR
jgi:dTDP-4-amino-4,6-dideoxygalactose transaminase